MSHELADYFWSGGTLSARAPSYIERTVDQELVEVLAEGEYAYVLDTRQIGKSSLVIRTREALRARGVRVALIDLTRAGTNLSPDQWYMSLLARVDESLGLGRSCVQAYSGEPGRPPMERFFEVLERVALTAEISPLVVVVDEIDVVLSLPFSADEFFAGIRECFVRRSVEPELNRLSFCLVGSASPASLIRNVQITPFNIGVRILPTDFSLVELAPYAAALSLSDRDGDALVRRVHHWTNGHPYLTQLLCGEIARDAALRSARDVDRLVDSLFLSPSATEADHLALLARRILESPEGQADRGALLDVLTQAENKPMRDDPADANLTVLKLAGIVRGFGGQVTMRNRLYTRHFGKAWIEENMPDAELRRRRQAVRVAQLRIGGISAVVAVIVGGLAMYGFRKAEEADTAGKRAIAKAQEAESANARTSLALKAANDEKIRADKKAADARKAELAAKAAEQVAKEAGEETNRALAQVTVERNNAIAAKSNADASAKNEKAAAGKERVARKANDKLLYQANMNLIQTAFDANRFARVQELLDESTKPAYAAFRGPEWGYWDYQINTQLFTLKGHTESVNSASFSPDGTRIVTASNDDTARVWDARDGQSIITLKGHTSLVNSASFSPDGARIVTASWDKTARVWDSRDGHSIITLKGHTEYVESASFSPDGARIVTASWDKTARVWDARDGHLIAKLEGHTNMVYSASFSPDGSRIVTSSEDNTALVWDANDWHLIMTLKYLGSGVKSVSFSPNGKRILTANGDRARVWNASDGKEVLSIKDPSRFLYNGTFSPDGSRIVTASHDNTARVWDARDGHEIAALKGHSESVNGASFSPDGVRVVTASSDGSARVWDARDGRDVAMLRGHTSGVMSASFSPDGAQIVTASYDKTARVWDARGGRQIAALKLPWGQLTSASFSPDGARVVTADIDGARVWDARDGDEIAKIKGRRVESASFSPDGARVVTADIDGARVWDARDGNEIAMLRSPGVDNASFSPDGTRIATVGFRSVQLWDARDSHLITQLKGLRGFVRSALFSPDGTRIVTAGSDNLALVWDACDGHLIIPLKGHTGRVDSASFSPSGERILTTSDEDKTARVWDARDGHEIAALKGHSGQVTGAKFSPTGERIVTADWDTVRLWDARDGRELLRFSVTAKLSATPFSPDGRFLLFATNEVAQIVPLSRAAAAQLTFSRQNAWVAERMRESAKAGDDFAWRWQIQHWLTSELSKSDELQDVFGAALVSPSEAIADDGLSRLMRSSANFLRARFAQLGALGYWARLERAAFVTASSPGATARDWRVLAFARLGLGQSPRWRTAAVAAAESGLKPYTAAADVFEAAIAVRVAPGALVDYVPLLTAVERAATTDQSKYAKAVSPGALLFRAGRYEEAERRLRPVVTGENPSQLGEAFFAMTLAKLGKLEEAKGLLARLDAWANAKPAQGEAETNLSAETWDFRLEYELLMKEAHGMLGLPEPGSFLAYALAISNPNPAHVFISGPPPFTEHRELGGWAGTAAAVLVQP